MRCAILFIAALLFFGCSQQNDADMALRCDMGTPELAVPASTSGQVLLTWEFTTPDKIACGPKAYGCTTCFYGEDGVRACHVQLIGKPATFKDTCQLARQGHEFNHLLGARHP
jgi:hypothetical protein